MRRGVRSKARIRPPGSWFGLGPNVGSGGNFVGNVDDFTVGTSAPANTTTFDFEPACTTVCYVSNTGSDSSTGSSPSQAFLTIQHAVNTVTAGGTVNVADGHLQRVRDHQQGRDAQRRERQETRVPARVAPKAWSTGLPVNPAQCSMSPRPARSPSMASTLSSTAPRRMAMCCHPLRPGMC